MMQKEKIEIATELGRLLYPAMIGMPGIITTITGLGFSIYKFREYRKTAILTIIALTIYLMLHAFSIFYPLVLARLISDDYGADAILSMNMTFSIVSALVGTATLILLLIAIWSGRPNLSRDTARQDIVEDAVDSAETG